MTQIHLIPGGLLGDVGSSCLRKPAAKSRFVRIQNLDAGHNQKMKEHYIDKNRAHTWQFLSWFTYTWQFLPWFKPCLNHVVSHLHLAPSKAFWATRTAEESSPKSICPRKARRPPYQRVTISRACSSKFLGFILAVWVVPSGKLT